MRDAVLAIQAEDHGLRAAEAKLCRERRFLGVGALRGLVAEPPAQAFAEDLEGDRLAPATAHALEMIRRHPPDPRAESALAAE